ncbi:MAG: transposase [bacterium]
MKTALAAAQVSTLRLRLLKIGGWIERSVRRVVVHLAAAHPWRKQWRQAARAWGAVIP